MKMLLSLLMGIPQTASGSTTSGNMSTTPVSTAMTTDFDSNPEVQRIVQLLETDFKDCADKQKDVCRQGLGDMGNSDRDNFCRTLKIVSQCIDKCDQELKDGVNQGLQDFSCGGCGILHTSLLVLILAVLVHYFV